MTEEIKQGMTRREVLKKAAVVGGTLGAVMWMAPVVRAQEIAPGAAVIPSETSCCLGILGFSAAYVAGAPAVALTLSVQNCSTAATNYDINVQGIVERLAVVGGVRQDPGVSVPQPGLEVGIIKPEETKDDPGYETPAPNTGTWVYRVHGLYQCPAGGGPWLDHTSPSDCWVYSNDVTV